MAVVKTFFAPWDRTGTGLRAALEPERSDQSDDAQKVLTTAMQLGVERVPFPVEITEVKAGDTVGKRDGYDIHAFPTEHGGGPSLGYVLKEHVRRGRFDGRERRKQLESRKVRSGERSPKGETVELADGRKLTADGFVGAARPGRIVAFTGDTRPCAATVDAAQGADLLIHEATFGEEERDRARDTGHATAKEAAQVALARRPSDCCSRTFQRGTRSARTRLVRGSTRSVSHASVAKDGLEVDVPFAE